VVYANRFLAALMFCYTAILLHILFQDTELYRRVPIAFILVGVPLAAMPLHFLYTSHLLKHNVVFPRKAWLHFLPFGIVEAGVIFMLLMNMESLTLAATASPANTPLTLRVFGVMIIVQGVLYLLASYRLIVRYNRHVKDVSSAIEQIQMNWLRNVTLAGLAAVILYFVEDMLLFQGINLTNFILVSIVFAVYVYAIGFTGLLKSEIFALPIVEQSMRQIAELTQIEQTKKETSRYEKSGLTDETAKHYLQKLLQLMEEQKPYSNPTLTLPQLSDKLSISPHNLSEVINTQLQKNFYDFINAYRIEQVKRDLVDLSKQHLKILSIALDAGFNSKAAFNTIFKEQTGTTPSEFRKSNSK
jgi:AraC-like DNA-binding protein